MASEHQNGLLIKSDGWKGSNFMDGQSKTNLNQIGINLEWMRGAGWQICTVDCRH